jgi:nucleoside-diphosphate-sugar epimerase
LPLEPFTYDKTKLKGDKHMDVLVTGATGFVGKSVVQALLQRNHHVVGLVRDKQKAERLAKAGVELAVGDMLSPESYAPLVQQVDAVIHAAQLSIPGRFSRARVLQVQQADKIMTETLSRECLKHDKKLVYTSGNFSYAPAGDQWITEESPMQPSLFGKGHYDMLMYLQQLHKEEGLKCLFLSAGFVYGAGGLFTRSFIEPLNKKQLRVIGSGNNYWSSIHVDDLGAAFALAVESTAYGENFNVVDDQPITLRDLVNGITDALGRPHLGTIPPWIMKLLLGAPLIEALVLSYRLSNAKIKAELGWSPRYPTFYDGLPYVLQELGLLDATPTAVKQG